MAFSNGGKDTLILFGNAVGLAAIQVLKSLTASLLNPICNAFRWNFYDINHASINEKLLSQIHNMAVQLSTFSKTFVLRNK